MVTLEDKLAKVKEEERNVLQRIDDRNANRKIPCACCGTSYKIKDVTAIQTHWYVPPSGCTEGDYWLPGGLQFVCPGTGTINRLLFNNNDVPWPERHEFVNNPEKQFIARYKQLFAGVQDAYDCTPKPWKNNFYVDEHRKKFGLVEKREK